MTNIVCKFGGSSVADAKAMLRCCEVIASRVNTKIVAVSATYNTTNELENLRDIALTGESYLNEMNALQERHFNIARELFEANEFGNKISVQQSLENIFNELARLLEGVALLSECSMRTMDQLYSIGERSSSVLFNYALNSRLQHKRSILKDARGVIITDNRYGQALPIIEKIQTAINESWKDELADENLMVVTQGFIGSTSSGVTTTLGREGSDFSATLLAEAIGADRIEIWKDVPGIATTDPRLIQNVQYIPKLSYSEMTELSTLGAKVLHPFTLQPAIRKKIPVLVASSYDASRPGTMITEKTDYRPLVQALAMRENQVLIRLTAKEWTLPSKFFQKVFQILENERVPLDLVSTHENTVTILLNSLKNIPNSLKDSCCSKLKDFCQVDITEGLALVSLVGHNMSGTKGFLSKLFASLEDYRVEQVNYGASKHGMSFLVRQEKAHQLLKHLHSDFVEDQSVLHFNNNNEASL